MVMNKLLVSERIEKMFEALLYTSKVIGDLRLTTSLNSVIHLPID